MPADGPLQGQGWGVGPKRFRRLDSSASVRMKPAMKRPMQAAKRPGEQAARRRRMSDQVGGLVDDQVPCPASGQDGARRIGPPAGVVGVAVEIDQHDRRFADLAKQAVKFGRIGPPCREQLGKAAIGGRAPWRSRRRRRHPRLRRPRRRRRRSSDPPARSSCSPGRAGHAPPWRGGRLCRTGFPPRAAGSAGKCPSPDRPAP